MHYFIKKNNVCLFYSQMQTFHKTGIATFPPLLALRLGTSLPIMTAVSFKLRSANHTHLYMIVSFANQIDKYYFC